MNSNGNPATFVDIRRRGERETDQGRIIGLGDTNRTADDAAIAAITQLYRELFPAGGAILDLMSGWVSHLPPEIPYRRVVGLGVRAREMAENPFLDEWRVQDLDSNVRLPFADNEFDGAALCLSVQNLNRPSEVIQEVGRVLKPGAPLIVTFSNCCVPARPVACWHLLDDAGHLCLIAHFFAEAGNWTDIRCLDRTPPGGGDPMYAVIGRSLGKVTHEHNLHREEIDSIDMPSRIISANRTTKVFTGTPSRGDVREPEITEEADFPTRVISAERFLAVFLGRRWPT